MSYTVAVLGTGTLTRKNAVALFKDATTDQEDVRVFISAQHYTDAARFLADHEGVSVHVFDTGASTDYDPADYPDAKVYSTEDAITSLAKVGDVVLYAYNEDEPEGQEAELTTILRTGAKVLDLCGGLFPLELGPEDKADEAQQAPVKEEPKPTPLKAVQEPVQKPLSAPAASTPNTREVEDVVLFYDAFTDARHPVEQARALLMLDDAIQALRKASERTTA